MANGFPLTEKTRFLGIVGSPVKDTLCPRMHNAALRHLGIDALYAPYEIDASELRQLVRAMPLLRFFGMSVTIPFKERVIRFMDEVSDEARQVGAVNTICVDKGRLVGHNTDGAGFVTALKAEGGISLRGERVVILGAGGAARPIAFHVLRQGVERICLANRTRARALALRRSLLRHFPEATVDVAGLDGSAFRDSVGAARFIVNTTAVGMKKRDRSIVPSRLISSSHVVVDIVYKPLRTPLIRAAEKAGARTFNGLGMLLYQGVLAFRLWTGKPAPVDVMKRALRSAPSQRR